MIAGNHIDERLDELKTEYVTSKGRSGHIHFHMEKPLPFVVVNRTKSAGEFSTRLIKNEAAYLIFEGNYTTEDQLFIKKLTQYMANHFGAFLMVEVWQKKKTETNQADFIVHGPAEKLPYHVRIFKEELEKIIINRSGAKVEISKERHLNKNQDDLLSIDELQKNEGFLLGLTICSSNFDDKGNIIYPSLERDLMKGLSRAIRKVSFSFVKVQTKEKIANFHELAPKKINDIVWQVDQKLSLIDKAFEFLLLITPVNHKEAWQEFEDSNYTCSPVFHYRMLPEDPDILKKQLYQIPVEEITDPTLNYIFRDKRLELDKMLTALSCRDSIDFLYSSLQIYGTVGKHLYDTALNLMRYLPAREKTENHTVDSNGFAKLVEEEYDFFTEQDPNFKGEYEISKNVPGLVVTKGKLYIPYDMSISSARADALIQHEVGTHILTYYNGFNQPLQLLHSGVPGYEMLQEGMAVFSEYLSGGISIQRLRTLAARVIAVYQMINGEDFPSVCNYLIDELHFTPRKAYGIVMRIFRGGGFTKDAVYLKGLIEVIDYLAKGNIIQPLLIGKIRKDYLSVIEELQKRDILKPNALYPRYLKKPEWAEKIKLINKDTSLQDLINFKD